VATSRFSFVSFARYTSPKSEVTSIARIFMEAHAATQWVHEVEKLLVSLREWAITISHVRFVELTGEVTEDHRDKW